ncbi:MAG: hypothetical protein NZ774_01310 [Candidatus Poseidoniales archaeon]|nr:hypothetical protein [Candidatus Poseidoniales archaeon]
MIRARFEQIQFFPLVIVAITLLLLNGLSMNVSAEHEWDHRYIINGEVFHGNGSQASDVEVMIDCSEGKSEPSLCEENIGRSENTSISGKFQLVLHVHSSDHGLRLVLDIDGESFNHTINLNGDDGQQTEEDRTVDVEFTLDDEVITLDDEVPKTGIYIILALVAMTIAVPFLNVIRNPKSSTIKSQGSSSSMKKKTSTPVEMSRCPKCDVKVKVSNLESHLMKVHHQSDSKAKELAESVKDN